MMKDKWILLLVVVIVLSLGTASIAEDMDESKFELRLKLGERVAKSGKEEIPLDVAPFAEEGRTMMPFRFIGEQLGAEIGWEQVEKMVSYTLGEMVVELWLDRNMALVNGEPVFIDRDNPDIVPIAKDGRTFIPVRFISEVLGFDVGWNGDSKEVSVVAKAETGDYNSSRSNKPRPIKEDDQGDKDDEDVDKEDEAEEKAQDYNSSRSNRPSPIKDLDKDEDKNDEDVGVGLVLVKWDDVDNKVIYKLKDNLVEIWKDKKLVSLNGAEIKIDKESPTIISNKEDKLFLGPIHFKSTAYGYTLEWNPERQELSISKR